MSQATLVALVGAAWLAIGLTLSLVMGRRGHDGFNWLVMGTLLGPLAIVLALFSWRQEEVQNARIVAEGAGGAHGVNVLVGFDGSPQSRSAIERVVALLGSRLGRLTIAAVVPYNPPSDAVRSARAELKSARDEVPRYAGVTPTLELIEGYPAVALESLATREGYDLIAVGTRGAGATKRVLGSTASRLARSTDVPVLVVSDTPRARSEDLARSSEAARELMALACAGWARSA